MKFIVLEKRCTPSAKRQRTRRRGGRTVLSPALVLLRHNRTPFLLSRALFALVVVSVSLALNVQALTAPSASTHSSSASTFVLLGGAGRIGTAVASHLLLQEPSSRIVLVGRNAASGAQAIKEVLQESNNDVDADQVTFVQIDNVWEPTDARLESVLKTADCVIHTAGPYADRKPTPLYMAVQAGCRVYVDVSDPLPYLETAALYSDKAAAAGTTALLSAGAFPGMSNVMAMEAASQLPAGSKAQDVRFQYFTAGLGGSGPLNLLITNIGFGEPMAQFDAGELRFFSALSGLLLGQVDFFIDQLNVPGFGNEAVRERVGTRLLFSWPFPEAATVATKLRARGNSLAGMSTAPAIWNDMLGLLVKLVPRPWWRNMKFSQFLADFSEPLVKATDWWLQVSDKAGGSGETHAMRVDVTSRDGPRDGPSISIVQAHNSFRRCVAQSCAEFALDCLRHPSPGVCLPEARYADDAARARVIGKLTSTPGTFCYTGPVVVESSSPPTNLVNALQEAKEAEVYRQ